MYPKSVATFVFGKYLRKSYFKAILKSYFVALLIAVIILLGYVLMSFNGNSIIIPPYVLVISELIAFSLLAQLILPFYEKNNLTLR